MALRPNASTLIGARGNAYILVLRHLAGNKRPATGAEGHSFVGRIQQLMSGFSLHLAT